MKLRFFKYLIRYFFVCLVCINCSSPKELVYLDSNSPKLQKQIFAPGFITHSDRAEFGSIFSKDGSEFFYADDTDGKAKIMYTHNKSETWQKPISLGFDTTYSYNDPMLSPDEQKLYYISNQPKDELDVGKDIDIWYSVRKDHGWSDPINAGPIINTPHNEYYISFTSDGSMYFASNVDEAPERDHDFDIYKSEFKNGQFQKPQKLPSAINTKRYEGDVYIAPDESYIIFCAARREGFGNGDLYISFKTENGEWTQSQNMGPSINTERHELCPFVTHDGLYLFFTSNQDIYWISTEIFESLKEGLVDRNE